MGVMEAKKHVRVLLVAFAAQGHINPMLRLGKRLRSKGLHVTLATTEIARSVANNAAAADGVNIEYFSDGLPLAFDRKSDVNHYFCCLHEFGPVNLSSLIGTHPGKFACIISNPFVPWVADVAAEHGIPCAMFWIQPCALYAIYYQFYNGLNDFPTETNPDAIVNLPGLPLLQKEDLPSFVLPSNPMSVFTDMLSDVFGNMGKLKWVLGNSFYELEKGVIESMKELRHPILPVGPIVPLALFGKEEYSDNGIDLFEPENASIEWLNKQDPSSVVYVSFGSLLFLSEKETKSIAMGLKKTNRPFLWVIKPPQNSADKTASFEFLEEIKHQGLVVKWCPQTKVLLHPSVGCFLSHCGWNSTLEAVTSGVPIVCYPQWTDQPTNAKLIAEVFGVGVRMKEEEGGGVSSEEVARCVEKIMSDPTSGEYRKRAAELRVAAREAVEDGGSSDRNIQMFVDEIVSCSSQIGQEPDNDRGVDIKCGAE